MAEKFLSGSLFQKVGDITEQLNIRDYHLLSTYQITIVLRPSREDTAE